MATTNFENGTVVTAEWLNDVDAFVYETLPQIETSEYSLLDYCACDGVTDDSTGLAAAVVAANGRPINGYGRTCRIATPVAVTNSVDLQKVTLDFSDLSGSVTGLQVSGTLGSSYALTAAVASGDSSFTYVGTATVVADQWIRISSDDVWATGNTVGEWVQVFSVVGNLITIYGEVKYDYTTTPVVHFITQVPYVRLRDVKTIGTGEGSTTHSMFLYYVDNVRIDSFEGNNSGYSAVSGYHCRDVSISNSTGAEADQSAGLGYLFAFSGAMCSYKVTNVSGSGYRHLVTAGGSVGVIQSYVVTNVTGLNMQDATVDAHGAVDSAVFTNICHDSNMVTGNDGVVSQARKTIIKNVNIKKSMRTGVLVQPFCIMYPSSIDIDTVTADEVTTNPVGINLLAAQTSYINIDGVQCYTGQGIAVVANTVGALGATRLSFGPRNHIVSSGRAINISFTAAAVNAEVISITGGIYKSVAVINETIMVDFTGATAPLGVLNVCGTTASGADTNLRAINYTSAVVTGNRFRNWVTAGITNIVDNGTTKIVSGNSIVV